jgi:prepilin-type N-terminal cleavage/methylation domain-containing protein
MSRTAEAGFTLLEILVGLAVSALIVVGLNAASASINRGFSQATRVIGRQDAIATGLAIVSGDISRILRVVDNPDNPQRFLFSGGSEELIYLLEERPGNNSAGVYWVRLSVRQDGPGFQLLRSRVPYLAGEIAPDADSWTDDVVVIAVDAAMEFSYRSPDNGLRDWTSDWQAGNQLPGQIRLRLSDLATGRLRVPDLVQTLKIGAEADCAVPAVSACTLQTAGALAVQR